LFYKNFLGAYKFYHLIFDWLRIRLHGFFRYDTSSLMSRSRVWKINAIWKCFFFKRALWIFWFFFPIGLSWSHDLGCKLTQVNLIFITWLHVSLVKKCFFSRLSWSLFFSGPFFCHCLFFLYHVIKIKSTYLTNQAMSRIIYFSLRPVSQFFFFKTHLWHLNIFLC
jgi:hypothetical protein